METGEDLEEESSSVEVGCCFCFPSQAVLLLDF